jgi:hypothetical protein
VIVTVVLLKVASMKAIPDETLFFFCFSSLGHYSVILIYPIRLTISFLSNSVVLIPLVVTIRLQHDIFKKMQTTSNPLRPSCQQPFS